MTVTSQTRPELLAPAGDVEAMRAGVANGADAIYFGLQDFNARRRAANFTLEQLPETVEFLHARNVKAFVAFNTLIFTDELARAERHLVGIARAGADAVIVQDLGLIPLIRRMAPTLPIHASTQTTQTHAAGLALLVELGVSRCILGRELSLEQIRSIAAATPMELEVFVHGALCISYSGQCLASESLWGRSANRGECAQACRLPYALSVDGVEQELGDTRYLLSPRDLALHERVGNLLAAGVRSFKIEGRLKSAAYVAATTAIYRGALDAAVAGRAFTPSREQLNDLSQSFSRGFTKGFIDGPRHQDLVQGRYPKSRGILLGEVVARTPGGVIVELSADTNDTFPVKPGDGVVFDAGRPDRQEPGGRVYAVKPLQGRGGQPRSARQRARVELSFARDAFDPGDVVIGSVAWKTDDPDSRRRLESTYARDGVVHRLPVSAMVRLLHDGRLGLTLTDAHGREGRALSREALDTARRQPLTVTLLREQLARLGDTPFELASVVLEDVSGPRDSVHVMAPVSLLNRLRREAVAALLEQRQAAAPHAVLNADALAHLRSTATHTALPCERVRPVFCVLVRTPGQLEATLSHGSATLVYCELAEWRSNLAAVRQTRDTGAAVGIATPRVLMPGEERLLERLADAEADVLLVRNLASLQLLRDRGATSLLVGDSSLNVANDLAARTLSACGIRRVTPAHDLDASQLARLVDAAPDLAYELVVHQHMPLFHTAYCLAAARLSDAQDCASCGRACKRHDVRLRDRNGMLFPVQTDPGGRSTIYAEGVQSAAGLMGQLLRPAVRTVRIEFLDEDPERVTRVLDVYAGLLHDESRGRDAMLELRRLYGGAVGPGTLQTR